MFEPSDFTKLFAALKLPEVPNMEAFVTANRRNMEAMAAANRIALEGAQTVAKRQVEIFQQGMTEMAEAMRGLAMPDSPQVKAASQVALLQQAHARAVAHIKELSDLIQRANAEAIDLLNQRYSGALAEIQTETGKS